MESVGGKIEVLEEWSEAADGVDGIGEDQCALIWVVHEEGVQI